MAPKKYKAIKLRIHGKVKGGEEISPLTLPMARLAEYLADFAGILGYRDYVHFEKVAEGSAAPVALIEIEKEPEVRARVKESATGFGPLDAMQAYGRLNKKLTEDDGYGEIIETIGDRESNLIEFPGKKRERSPIFGPIKEAAFVQGELRRVGGKEPTIPVWVEDADGRMYYCHASKAVAQVLGNYLFQPVRLNGIATWLRNENAVWELQQFEVQSYAPPLSAETAATVLNQLRSVPGSEWHGMDDPLEELRQLRHGKDEIQ